MKNIQEDINQVDYFVRIVLSKITAEIIYFCDKYHFIFSSENSKDPWFFSSDEEQYFIYAVDFHQKHICSKLQQMMNIKDTNRFISLASALEKNISESGVCFGYLVSDYIPDIKNDKSK